MSNRASFVALSLLLAGCTQPMPGEPLMGTVARRTAPSTADLGTLSEENTQFSIDLLNTVYTAAPTNTVLSPWSVQVVLAQVYAGGDSAVQTSIVDTFGWSLTGEALHEAFDAADLSVASHDAPEAEPAVALTTTNQIFSDLQFDIGPDWLNTLSEFYGTGVQQMDLAGNSAGAADSINAWVADRTGGHITELVDAGSVSASGLLLVNAVYFNASWPVQFSTAATEDAAFTLLDGSTVDVPTMSGGVAINAAPADGFFVADLPYSDPGLTLTVVVPDEGRFTEVLAGFDAAALEAAVAAETVCGQCEVRLPRFEVHGAPDMDAALLAMGLGPAYGGAYPGINGELSLRVRRKINDSTEGDLGPRAQGAKREHARGM